MFLPNLGGTRSILKHDHLLQTPDTFVRAPLPGMRDATAIVHAGAALGAKFTQYTAEMQGGGRLGPTNAQRFVFVLDGDIVAGGHKLAGGGYVFVPEGGEVEIAAVTTSRAIVIEKPYERVKGIDAPAFFVSRETEREQLLLNGDAGLRVRILVPDGPEHDFAVNTMTYDPGASLSMVEVHVMEHGLLMLEGGGIYKLGECWYPVTAGDFIWMGPYCPQWFGALGKQPAKYLIYKNWNRFA